MIRRAPRPDCGFVIIRNEVARDGCLSYRARGLLVAILSRPDNWTVSAEQLASEVRNGEGARAVLTALKELESAGYLERRRVKNANGRFIWEQVIYDIPQPKAGATDVHTNVSAGHTTRRFPSDGFPSDGNRRSKEEPKKNNREEDVMNCPAPFGRGRASDEQDHSASLSEPVVADDASNVTSFEDWRAEDRALFNAIAGERITSDGTVWKAGVYPAAAWYEGFRQNKAKPIKWPGRYFEQLQDNDGLEDWLADKGLEAA